MFDASHTLPRSADFGAVLWRALGWPARVIEARQTLTQLAQMTDRELSDIGLLRADLANSSALPLDEDPGDKLARARAVRAWYGHSHCGQAA
jgi:uncharacterized protein YjiS (DUF1127 family)